MVEKQLEQGEVGAGEKYLLAIQVMQPMADQVEAPVIESQDIAGRPLLGELGAAQQRLDPRQQLARAERLPR